MSIYDRSKSQYINVTLSPKNVDFEPIKRRLENNTFENPSHIYVGYDVGKKMSGKYVHEGGRGGVRRLMEKSLLNFHFDYLTTSLTDASYYSDTASMQICI